MLRTIELSGEELAAMNLRSLYSSRGYAQYRMSKFEEYDLYSNNKDFLLSNRIITFTDTNGKLMALKPDVTLSIIKNTRNLSEGLMRLYYDERVYRVAAASNGFREIRQIGLECMGDVDTACVSEVLGLAAESLTETGFEAILNVSHLSVLSSLFNKAGLSEDARQLLTAAAAEKNVHELRSRCAELGVSAELTDAMAKLISVYGTPAKVFAELDPVSGLLDNTALDELKAACESLPAELQSCLRLDFSVTGDMKYYNGIVFKGFLEGVPAAVLSGGQYDGMMRSMGRSDKAIGFAVYMDMLERLYSSRRARYSLVSEEA